MSTMNSEAKANYGASVLVKSQSKFENVNQVSTDIPDFTDGNKTLSSFNTPNKFSSQSRRISHLVGNGQTPKEDYIKKILGKPQNPRMGDSLTRDGPTFGKSRIGFGAQSSYSGSRKSNTTTGGGLASRFQLALSKVIDPTSANPDGTASPRGTDDEDI